MYNVLAGYARAERPSAQSILSSDIEMFGKANNRAINMLFILQRVAVGGNSL